MQTQITYNAHTTDFGLFCREILPTISGPTLERNNSYSITAQEFEQETLAAIKEIAETNLFYLDEACYFTIPNRAIIAVWGLGKNSEAQIFVRFYGEWHLTKQLMDLFDAKWGQNPRSVVTWAFKNEKSEITYLDNILAESKPVYGEFYPQIHQSIDTYLDSYWNSSASILLMVGKPGTGKTSLLRYMLNRYQARALVSYEDSLLGSDNIFVNFLTGPYTCMVIEDADTLLKSRISDGNKDMARFLTASDGLLQFPKKKMVFTTNLEHIRDIDEALLRPGRCFDILHFRSLTESESQAAAAVAGVSSPTTGSHTLAEIFNPGASRQQSRIGI